MRNLFRSTYWTAAIAVGLFLLGSTKVQAQLSLAPTATVQQGGTSVGKTTNVNPNLYRQNALSRPILQPKQTRRINNRTPNNNLFPNLNQPGTFTPGSNPFSTYTYPNIYQAGSPGYSYP